MDITEVTLIHHVGLVLALLWLLSHYNCCHALAYFLSLIYLFVVHERYVMRLRKKLQFEERKQGNQRRVLSDSETVRWLNHAVEKIWPICMEQIASQRVLLPIIPWFLEKYKPWTVSKGVVQHLYLGRNAPMFTEMRVLRQSTGDDHLVLELGMNFLTADDMLGILAVKLKKRLGFGIWAKLHITGMHVEGKVMIGVKFLRKWPFLGRVRLCFVEPPYFQMTVKPIFTRGLDVTEVPGIDGWLDKLLSIAFEQTLVQPNMLVVDMEKFTSPEQENWFSVDEKEPVGHLKVEVIEASDMKASDLNGFSDPYVKGQFGVYQFKTKIQKKTLTPKWFEEFKIPIITWDSPNVLAIEVHDRDIFVDDTLGNCSINIGDLRDGVRHDMWLPLQNIKTAGRLHLAITVLEDNGESSDPPDVRESKMPNMEDKRNSFSSETANKNSFSSVSSEKSPRVADNYEPIDVEGQKETGIWVHHPGSEVSQTWEARKGKGRRLSTQIQGEPNGSSVTDETQDDKHPMQSVRRGLRKLGSVFQKNPKKEDNSCSFTESVQSPVTPRVNLRAINEKDIAVKYVVEDEISGKVSKEGASSSGESSSGSPGKGKVKGMAKSFFKHAERSVKHALSRKGSRKSQTDSCEREIIAGSDSSDDDDTPPSPIVEMIPVVSRDIPHPPVNDSFKSDEHLTQLHASALSNIPEDTEDSVKKVEPEDTEKTLEKPDDPEKNNEGLPEPLKVEAR
ncbi:putative C2 domain-containing protein [Rosa chinensis]|uniref:Putative C2 domain-containing protein n=1 Tax=Rosa chinensis TaxID=74649 RepID=A0A2P6Q9C6_ROSCH|nr:C2 domain-containing protein At1g53590 isoform X2 [Rosa chinensis]PRQ30780.1 putative C2 domain-containing protein [Rosa chinensis]